MKPRWLLGAVLATLLIAGCAPDDDLGPAEPADPPAEQDTDTFDDGY